MYSLEEITALLEKGSRLMDKHKENRNLISEVALLRRELQEYKKPENSFKEMIYLNCEYFANELKKTISDLK